MSSDLERFLEIKKKAEQDRRIADRDRGALDQLMTRLKEEHGYDSLQEAEKEIQRLERRIRRVERTFHKALKKFEQKWGHKLGNAE